MISVHMNILFFKMLTSLLAEHHHGSKSKNENSFDICSVQYWYVCTSFEFKKILGIVRCVSCVDI